MPLAPDWLLNMTSTAPGLVEDSPEYRRLEEQTQINNLNKAANSALGQVKAQTDAMEQQTLAQNQQTLDKLTPVENPIHPTRPFFSPEEKERMARPVPTPDQFNLDQQPVRNPTIPPPLQPGASDADTVMHIAQTLGVSPQQVAALALIGQDIRSSQYSSPPPPPPGQPTVAPTITPPPSTVPQPGQPSPMPVPLAGPPVAPPPQAPPAPVAPVAGAPLSALPVPQPAPNPMPSPLVPPQ